MAPPFCCPRDGTIVIAGGEANGTMYTSQAFSAPWLGEGRKSIRYFYPGNLTWKTLSVQMNWEHWYPTQVGWGCSTGTPLR